MQTQYLIALQYRFGLRSIGLPSSKFIKTRKNAILKKLVWGPNFQIFMVGTDLLKNALISSETPKNTFLGQVENFDFLSIPNIYTSSYPHRDLLVD